MQDRKQHPLEKNLFDILLSKKSDTEKSVELKECIKKIKECKDAPPPKLEASNLDSEDYDTALHCAVYSGSILCTQVLIEAKAYLDASDVHGDTPLHWAIFKNKPEIVELLLTSKANINLKNLKQHTPLDDFFLDDNIKPSKLGFIHSLIVRGALPNVKTNEAITFLKKEYEKGNELAYFCLGVIASGTTNIAIEAQKNTHAISEEQESKFYNEFSSLNRPLSAQGIDTDTFAVIDLNINTERFPKVLLTIIKEYDLSIQHSPLFFRSPVKNTINDHKDSAEAKNTPKL